MTNRMMPSCGPRVVIVGAGVAGIAAASRLIENGFANCIILEAEDRVGGRICTRRLGDGVVDLGAQYCRKDSIVYHLVKDFDLLEVRNVSTHVYHSQNGRLEDSFVNKLLDKVSDLYHGGPVQNVEWKQYLEERFDDEIVDLFHDERQRLLARDNMDFVKKQVLLCTGSICLNGVYGATSGEFPPDFRCVWKSHGYQALLDILMKKHLKTKSALQYEQKVILNSEVTKIEWGEEDGAKVICANGLYYLADYVIVTVPLGALKRQHSTLFSPALPKTKQKVIELLGFGSILKVCFHFSTKWWSDNDFAFAWGEEDLKTALIKVRLRFRIFLLPLPIERAPLDDELHGILLGS
uniref:Amine oxidase domain-containing protein n=1 Tax=Photinus pyralis TaxID=7054 RepID=A0A1Y1K1Z4_PHOPY